MSHFHLRPASPSDADLIHALTLAAYREYDATDAPSSVLDERADDLRAALTGGGTRALIAETDGKPVGSVRYQLEAGELYFFRLGILPEARGQGLAQQILTHLECLARRYEANRLRCRVRLNVARNVRLYENAGFQLIDQELVRRGTIDVPTGTLVKRLVRDLPRDMNVPV